MNAASDPRTRRGRSVIGVVAALAALASCDRGSVDPGLGTLTQALANVPAQTAPYDFAKSFTITPTLQATVSSGTSGTVDTEFDWGTDPNFGAFTSSNVNGVATGGTASYTLTAGQALLNVTTYYWRAR